MLLQRQSGQRTGRDEVRQGSKPKQQTRDIAQQQWLPADSSRPPSSPAAKRAGRNGVEVPGISHGAVFGEHTQSGVV